MRKKGERVVVERGRKKKKKKVENFGGGEKEQGMELLSVGIVPRERMHSTLPIFLTKSPNFCWVSL